MININKLSVILFIVAILFSIQIKAQKIDELGKYFSKKEYVKTPLPIWDEDRDKLPIPILEDNPGWIKMYWKCWEIAFKGLKQPKSGSPLVSNWIDEAFSENIFQWDTIFMVMFARYGHQVFPAIQSLDNFYRLQYESGFIGREFRERDGVLIHFDFDGGLFSKKGWKNMINPPLFSWAEVESYKLTGDKSRFKQILPVLEKYAEWLNRDGDPDAENWELNGRISKNSKHKLYWNTPLGCGMDNTPRPTEKGSGWVEMSAQMVIMYNNLSIICDELNDTTKANIYRNEAKEISSRINKWCWNEDDGFYYDVNANGEQFRKKTIGGFWTLLAGIANKMQAEKLVKHLRNENEFWRKIVFPSLSADEKEFRSDGGYWLGGVWAPTNVMIIKGLEKYGFDELATEATEKYLSGMYKVFQDSNTVYENYSPDFFLPGNPSRADFVGWSGCGPIQLLIENILGFEVNGANNELIWKINRTDRHGIKNLMVGTAIVDAIYEVHANNKSKTIINVKTSEALNLKIYYNGKKKEFELKSGEHQLIL